MWIYPWDILDEGPRLALRRARELAGIDALNLAVTYHAGLFLLPHNPRRRLYTAEDGVVYFRADPEPFPARLAPVRSVLTERVDPLRVAGDAARREGLGLRAWVVCCHNSRLGRRRPDLTVQNALGDRLPFALCPSQPVVRHYLRGLVRALRAYEGLEAVELEALYWLSAEHAWHHAKFGTRLSSLGSFLLGLCCCAACARRAVVDRQALIRALRPALLGELKDATDSGACTREAVADLGPDVAALLETREATLSTLLRELAADAHVPVRAMLGSGLIGAPWRAGIDVAAWAAAAPFVALNAYASDPAVIRADLSRFRALAPGAALVVGLNGTHQVTGSAESLVGQALAAAQSGPVELSFYHYGLLPLERLAWVRRALEAVRTARDEAALGH